MEGATYDVHKIRLNCNQFIVQNIINSDCHNCSQRGSVTTCCLLQSTTKQLLVRYRVIFTALIPVGPTVTMFISHSVGIKDMYRYWCVGVCCVINSVHHYVQAFARLL
jgi:hypothetical protein